MNSRAEAQMDDRLSEMDWYFGNISRKEADEILAKSTRHTFLIRESSVPDCYACSVYNFNIKYFLFVFFFFLEFRKEMRSDGVSISERKENSLNGSDDVVFI